MANIVSIQNLFFEYDEGGRRGHSKKLLEVKNIHLATEWNSLTDACVNCIMVNNFKNHILKELEPETFEYYHV